MSLSFKNIFEILFQLRNKSERVVPIIYAPVMLACAVAALLVNPVIVERFLDADGRLWGATSLVLWIVTAIALTLLGLYSYMLVLWQRGCSVMPQHVANWTLSLLGVVVLLVCVEAGFRVVSGKLLKRDIYESNPNFGMSYTKPNLDERLVTAEYDVRFQTNAIGLRDTRQLVSKRPSEYRIVLVGDSFVQAAQVELQHTAAYRLEEELRRKTGLGDLLTVFNLSRSGWTSTNERRFLERNISLFEPNLVVLVTYVGNDIIELMIKQRRSLEAEGEGLWKAVHRLAKSRRNPSHLARFFAERLDAKVEWPMGRPNQPFFSPYLKGDAGNVFKKLYSPEIDAAYEVFFADLREIQSICKERGSELVLAVAPTKEQVHAGDLAEVVEFMELNTEMLDLEKPQRIVREFATANGIPVIDLLDPMREAGKASRLYFSIDSHWNAEGNRIAAKVLAQNLALHLQEQNYEDF